MERVWSDGRIDPQEILPAAKVWNGFTYFRRDDVLVAKITPCFENGKGAHLHSLPTAIGFGSTEFHVLRAKSFILPQFLYRLTTVSEFRSLGTDAMIGAAGQQRVPSSFMANYPISLPPLPEQTAIVRYLDHADERIRRYVSGKQKLIRLLEEEKQAVIHRAVTRGLNPNVRLKPSGVEWLGDVPAHWEVRRLRTVAEMRVSNVDKHTKENEFPVRLCNYVDVYKNDRITQEMSFMKATASRDEIERFRLKQDDVLITKDSEAWDDIGVPALVTEPADDLISGYHLALLRPFNQMLGAYLAWTLQSKAIAYQFHVEAKGVTRYGLTHAGIQSVNLPLPPLPEQAAIVRYLDKATADIDTAISRTRRQIELLQEYRTRLIADVVTGKLDVRGAAANLPDAAYVPQPPETVKEPDRGDQT